MVLSIHSFLKVDNTWEKQNKTIRNKQTKEKKTKQEQRTEQGFSI